MDKKIVFLWNPPKNESLLYNYYIDSCEELYEKNWIKFYFFFIWSSKYNLNIYNKKWIFLQWFENIEKMLETLKKLNHIIYIWTFNEGPIPTTHYLRKELGIVWTQIFEIFNNKELQRKFLLDYDNEITVKYLEYDEVDKLKIEEIENKIWYPFIIKPTIWLRSMLVTKIENRLEFDKSIQEYTNYFKKYQESNLSTKILIEEFVDWSMYSIDYFVDDKQKIYSTMPVKVVLLSDLWYNDFLNLNRIIWEIPEKELQHIQLDKFIENNVLACGIKNTFIHHEFKLNSKWQLKTIELNWRIWWFRLQMYKEAYNFNLFNLVIKKKFKKNDTMNSSTIWIYSLEKWILKSFNKSLFESIRKLSSFSKLKLLDDLIWKECWLSSQWFWSVWNIKLKNKSSEKLQKDIEYIYNIYKDLTILEKDNKR